MKEKQTLVKGFFWDLFQRWGNQIINIVIGIILARLLTPQIFGTVALVTAIVYFLRVFIDSGLNNALIQKKDVDVLDYSSVFFFNIGICLVLYIGMFCAAPFIADFYDIPILVPVVRVISLMLVFNGLRITQDSYLRKKYLFKLRFRIILAGLLLSAAASILMAVKGMGIWALVVQNVLNSAAVTVLMWLTVPKHIACRFSVERLKGLLNFGYKLLICSILSNIVGNIRSMIIGKVYAPADLAFYDRGKMIPDAVAYNINTSILYVCFPAIANMQNNLEQIKLITRRAICTSCFFMLPAMTGLFVCAEPIIRLFLSDKWLACVPFVRVFCAAVLFLPISTINEQCILALGRSDITLKIGIANSILTLLAIMISCHYSSLVMAMSMIPVAVIYQLMLAWYAKKMYNYSYLEQLRDILQSLLISIFMGACIYPIYFLRLHYIVVFGIQLIVGCAVYFGMSYVTKSDALSFIICTFNDLRHKK